MNFSFILRGTGEYRHPAGAWPVEAPCVITQEPGIYVEYGPTTTWEELYVIYEPDCEMDFRARNLFSPDRPCWPIQNISPVRERMEALNKAREELHAPGAADRLDRLCEWMVMESRMPGGEESDPRQQALARAEAHIVAHMTEVIDFDELALNHGISPSHFRRLWNERIGQPPARYQMGLRIRKARRMLVETKQPVNQIAAELGFADALYFSRKFRQATSASPTQYRALHRWPLSMEDAEEDDRD